LAACAAFLVADGWHVVLPSRRHAPISTVPNDGPATGRAVWVAADWADPAGVALRARHALGGPADLVVAWVHREHRAGLLHAVEPLLVDGAPVVEVLGSGAVDPLGGFPDPVLSNHPTQQVVLGFVPAGGTSRRLNHEEISEGVLAAVDRALAGRAPAVHQFGEARPWPLPN